MPSSARDDGQLVDRVQLRALLAPHGYTVEAVDVTGCLHLKSAATEVADGTLLVQRDWLEPAPFADELAKAEGGVTCCSILVP